MTLMMMQQSRSLPPSSANLLEPVWEEPEDLSQSQDFEPIVFSDDSINTEQLAEEAIQQFTSESIEQPEITDNSPS
jgi:hypothetical protein